MTPVGHRPGPCGHPRNLESGEDCVPDHTLTVEVVAEHGDTVATESTWVGTNTGSLVPPDGTRVPPTGKRVEHGGMELAHVRDGKIAGYHMYWDGMAIASSSVSCRSQRSPDLERLRRFVSGTEAARLCPRRGHAAARRDARR